MAKEKHYYKDPNTIDINHLQSTIKNYQENLDLEKEDKNTLVEEIRKVIIEVLNNIFIAKQKRLIKEKKYFNCRLLGHFAWNCRKRKPSKTLFHNKATKINKNKMFREKRQKKVMEMVDKKKKYESLEEKS